MVKEFLRVRDESWDLAQSVVYEGLEEGAETPETYISRAAAVGEKRVAMGGLRLGAFLRRIYGELHGSRVEKKIADKEVSAAENEVYV